MLICNVVGARPNFMKIAPVVLELKKRGIPQLLVHTGQHYDENMSQVFFEELGLPEPDVYLGVGSDSHTRQTARTMMAFEEVGQAYNPDLIVVGGDVNSTLAVALVAAKQQIPLAHVEAGLRSCDRTMPEESNRIITDHLSALLFTTEEAGNQNLKREGINEGSVHFVGNCMVDSLWSHVQRAVDLEPWREFGVQPGGYALLTLHRPSNVDDPWTLRPLLEAINEVSFRLPVIFPVHPRTWERMNQGAILVGPSITITRPLSYLTFLGLMARARCVLTDSGGIQEETTALNIPCLTLRWNTERPVTVESGTNRLVGTDPKRIHQAVEEILAGNWVSRKPPVLWDGKAGYRIAQKIEEWAGEGWRVRLPAKGGLHKLKVWESTIPRGMFID
jgi:UDP-N-acetylglucosamine 2-epimerase (non-hydrolysing)